MSVLGGGVMGMQPELQPKSRGGSTAVGILLILGGILAILLPFIIGVAVTGLLGWLLLFAGLAHFYFAWHARSTGAAVWTSLIGLLYVIGGLYLILHPERGLLTLTLLLAIWFTIEGVFELIAYFRLRSRHGVTGFLVNGLITLVLGVLIWAQWPFSSVWPLERSSASASYPAASPGSSSATGRPCSAAPSPAPPSTRCFYT